MSVSMPNFEFKGRVNAQGSLVHAFIIEGKEKPYTISEADLHLLMTVFSSPNDGREKKSYRELRRAFEAVRAKKIELGIALDVENPHPRI